MTLEETITFSVWDYIIFSSLFVVSILFGVYYTFRPVKTTNEYLMGNRQMGIIPVTASLTASHFSAVLLLGIAAEVYHYGGAFILSVIEGIFVALATTYIYLPVFYGIKCTSIFEYLELRFNKRLQLAASIGYHLVIIGHATFLVYAPALITSQATGLGLYTSVLIIGITCTVYTSLGGIKAVMWTDTFQCLFMLASVLAVLIIGCIEVGGISHIWQKSLEHNKLNILNFDINPATRYTVWTIMIGDGMNSMTKFAANQPYVQRYLSTSSLKSAKLTVWLNYIGSSVFIITITLIGLVLVGAYWDCDPYNSNKIESRDQILSYFVLQRVGAKYPGLSGLFTAGLISCAISTLSSSINSLAAVTFKQLIEPFCTKPFFRKNPTFVIKLTAFIYGTISIIFVPIVERMGGIYAALMSFISAIMGPTFGIFTLGMLFPRATPMCATLGAAVGFVIPTSLLIGSQIYKPAVDLPQVSINGCNMTTDFLTNSSIALFNQSTFRDVVTGDDDVSSIFRISYLWYRVIGAMLTIGIGILTSYVSGWDHSKNVDPKLISPVVHKINNFFISRKSAKVARRTSNNSRMNDVKDTAS